MSLLRYPGGKSKLKKPIVKKLLELKTPKTNTFISPFFGGGSVEFEFLQQSPQIKDLYINDKDPGIACLWTSVLKYPEAMKFWIMDFEPSLKMFETIKEQLLELDRMQRGYDGVLYYGLCKLVLHQMSYSGLGTRGGPLGGKEQKSAYPIGCRWSPKNLCKQIDKLHKLLSNKHVYGFKCTNLDFEQLLINTHENDLIYLDPPYYIKGNELYQYGFTTEDHKRLCYCLKANPSKWLLSYDDCPEIRDLYRWANIEEIDANYKIAKNGTKKKELLIYG